MKSTLFLLLFICANTASFSQSQWFHFAEEFYFVKEVSVKEYRGKNFRYEIAVKALPSDTLSKTRVHGINVGKGKEEFISSDFKLETRTEQEWTVYTVAGTVDENAWRLWFYTAVNGNGEFYFDDISFYVEESPGRWKQINLANNSFEAKHPNIFNGYYVSRRSSKTLATQISNQTYKTGSRSLKVISKQQQPVALLTSTQQ